MQLLEGATDETKIAVVSAPSVFVQVKNLLASGAYGSPQTRLLEYDQRFDVFDDEFVHYNYETPMRLPGKYAKGYTCAAELTCSAEMNGVYNRVLCDPPFLSADCQAKGEASPNSSLTLQSWTPFRSILIVLAAVTVRWLSDSRDSSSGTVSASRIIVCTGERMEDLISKLYPGIRPTTFEPRHEQNRLSNAFRCYANYECALWRWQDQAVDRNS